MLTLDHFELIRRRHFMDGLSIRAISRTLGHSRKTVRKALLHGSPPGYRRSEPAALPVMDKVSGIVDAWLEQDRDRPANGRPFKGMIGKTWGHDFDLIRRELEYRYEGEGTKKFVNVLLLFSQCSEDEVRQAVQRCVRRRAFSDEAVVGVLRNEPLVPGGHR